MHKPYVIPEHVDPFRLAEQQIHLHGVVRIQDLPRLCPSLSNTEGNVEVKLDFLVDEQGVPCVKAHIEAKLILQCQRCMEAFNYEIMSDFASGLVDSQEKAEQLPDSYDPVVVVDNQLPIRDLIEDELILSTPIVPKHVVDECKVKMPYVESGKDSEQANPFYVLKQPVVRKTSKK